jgi:ribosomal protein S18 acetylase RimI-like enzyme
MRVRDATVEDCEPLARAGKVVADEGRWLVMESDTSVAELAGRFRRAIEDEGHLLFVLEDGSEPVGALGMHATRAKGVLSLGMWILPQWRGHGGGRQLLRAALEARPAYVHKLELEVFPDNAAAIDLYRSMGFEEEGLRRNHYRRLDGSLRSALLMARLFETEDSGD